MSTTSPNQEMELWTPVECERSGNVYSLLKIKTSTSLLALQPIQRGEQLLNASWREWFIRRLKASIGFPASAIVKRDENGVTVSTGASHWSTQQLYPAVYENARYVSERQLKSTDLPFIRFLSVHPNHRAHIRQVEWYLRPRMPLWHDSFQRLTEHVQKVIGDNGNFYLWTEAMLRQRPEQIPDYKRNPVTIFRSAEAVKRWGKFYSGAILFCSRPDLRDTYTETIEYELTRLFVPGM